MDEGICYGVVKLVKLLNDNGFITTDSGDGSHFKDGMECAVSYPMVLISSTPHSLVEDTKRLKKLLEGFGVDFSIGLQFIEEDCGPHIQAMYDPANDRADIILSFVLDSMLVGVN